MLHQDQPTIVRNGEELNIEALAAYLNLNLLAIKQFPGGYSNLTYCLESPEREFVLRKPPKGAKDIKGGHDMAREFRIIKKLKTAGYAFVPKPIILCENEAIIGSVFYVMERVNGVIIRAKDAKKLQDFPAESMKILSEKLVDALVALHAIDIENSGLKDIGKPQGFVKRQVEGWIARYQAAATDDVDAMNFLAQWLQENMPAEQSPTMIHNDFKYDNVVLDPTSLEIKAILDWEMSTVGDPLMDLGAMLSYWAEDGDGPFEKSFNISWLPGNLTRKQIVERYAQKSGRDLSNIIFYYAFGTFKNATIAQQIYARFKKGLTQDPRFGELIHGVKAFATNGKRAIETAEI